MPKFLRAIIFALFISTSLQAQVADIKELDQKYLNWFNMDLKIDKVLGTSVNKAYGELLRDKQPKKTIIVAVIDGGVDINHVDFKDHIWLNEDEIPGNNIDDDNNGYIDDIHGWNFIGNSNGENIKYENFEYTRIYKDPTNPDYTKAKELYEKEYAKRIKEKESIAKFEEAYYKAKSTLKEHTGIEVLSADDLSEISSNNPEVSRARTFLWSRYNQGFTEKGLMEYKQYNADFLAYFLNTTFNARDLVGDDPSAMDQKVYGNPDVIGPRADHGTSVAGVIAAVRDNEIGIDGIASHVKIMALRSTPRGDERDKDVALAIRYAVENGASIINMSFGKALSPQKKLVDEAVKFAEERNVLLVHGSGNDSRDIDVLPSYPSDQYLDGTEASNWLTVGASAMTFGEEMVGVFSNYGAKHVDIFAPGVDIISLDSTNTYSKNDGTSLAAPVVSGIAALVLSYYPDLTPQELIDILMTSSIKLDKEKVFIPDREDPKRKRVKFGTLSKSGGIVSAYEALKLAERYKK
jgi:subtilisin family serine protease